MPRSVDVGHVGGGEGRDAGGTPGTHVRRGALLRRRREREARRVAQHPLAEALVLAQRRHGGEGLTAVLALDLLATVGVHSFVSAQVRELSVRFQANLSTRRATSHTVISFVRRNIGKHLLLSSAGLFSRPRFVFLRLERFLVAASQEIRID